MMKSERAHRIEGILEDAKKRQEKARANVAKATKLLKEAKAELELTTRQVEHSKYQLDEELHR